MIPPGRRSKWGNSLLTHPSLPPLSIRRWLKWSKEGKKKTPPPPPSLFSGQGLRRNGGSGSEMEFQNAIINALLPQDDGSKKKMEKQKLAIFSGIRRALAPSNNDIKGFFLNLTLAATLHNCASVVALLCLPLLFLGKWDDCLKKTAVLPSPPPPPKPFSLF